MLAKRRRQRTTDHRPWATDKRRGVTLVEMLVTVAVLVIMMTILVQIFQAATGSVSAAQAYQQLDDQLRRLDSVVRSDLERVTAHFTPPLDPQQNLGYFEYGENEFADNQGEDSDDYIRFTTQAPPGQPFTGRFWPQNWPIGNLVYGPNQFNASSFPITISSEYAEIIYFVRNGNLYRRVLLVAPQLQPNILVGAGNQAVTVAPAILGGPLVSWQGANNLSARPTVSGSTRTSPPTANNSITLNSLGDLTNRENRPFYARYSNDFIGPDGLADDANSDTNADLYPSLYALMFSPVNIAQQLVYPPPLTPASPALGVPAISGNTGAAFLAFPYIFPGAYSRPQALPSAGYSAGWIHAPSPYAVDTSGNQYSFDSAPLAYLQNLNHNPLDLGDNLPNPNNSQNAQALFQTWWGFPTWRETLSPSWADPAVQVNVGGVPPGLNYGSLAVANGVLSNPGGDANLLPPMADPSNFGGSFAIFRSTQQLFCDGAGQASAFWGGANAGQTPLWSGSWEDDLIMTGVRSFDVKAYDSVLQNYADLGWGDDIRLYTPYPNASIPNTPPYLLGNPGWPAALAPGFMGWPPINSQFTPIYSLLTTFAHEGRMPPLQADNRLDYQNPNPNYVSYTAGNFTPQYPAYPLYSSNVGDDNPNLVRLRRVWDSWSTDYSYAPATGVNAANFGTKVGPPYGSPPIYPSYPPPYPAPLRGIQIQIRVVDPKNQRIKSLTIRQDFTDKL